ncbi:protein shisa-4-like isoform X2 [Neocloeon triangulifer]|uniref:protein shisa-4-like isoform X2 n=1 Tax=Neocloeon triangulifer TaxID=2078957 RepID=UPI00286F6A70|nr:protein shisa-4-like isoform X2 [Neocloeon triangulifer]
MHRQVRRMMPALLALQTLISAELPLLQCNPNSKRVSEWNNLSDENDLSILINPHIIDCPHYYGKINERYCCYGTASSVPYCCDAEEFTKQSHETIYSGSFLHLHAIFLIATLVVIVVICCVCCFCCPCCILYKRKKRGVVLNAAGRGAQPEAPSVHQGGPQSSVHQQLQYNPQYPPQGYPPQQYAMVPQQNYPLMHQQNAYPPVVPHLAAEYSPAVASQGHPVPTSEISDNKPAELYTRQAPYNPHF